MLRKRVVDNAQVVSHFYDHPELDRESHLAVGGRSFVYPMIMLIMIVLPNIHNNSITLFLALFIMYIYKKRKQYLIASAAKRKTSKQHWHHAVSNLHCSFCFGLFADLFYKLIPSFPFLLFEFFI